MAEPPVEKQDMDGKAFAQRVGVKAARKLKARRKGVRSIWYGFGMIGLIGWSVVLPTILGAWLGRWLDETYPLGRSWTIALMMIGLFLGCANAWRWVAKEGREMRDEEENHDK